MRSVLVRILISACLLAAPAVYAVPAAPITITLTQADDGSTFEARQQGDEYVNWFETLDGYTIVESAGVWFYAQLQPSGELGASPSRVGALNAVLPAEKHLNPTAPAAQAPERYAPTPLPTTSLGAPLPATLDVLVILADFADITFNYSDASFQSLIFGASPSVKDFYLDNSYNNFTMTAATESYGTANDGIVHVTLAGNHPNQGSNSAASKTVAIAAVTAADGSIDYSAYDDDADGVITARELSIIVILAGYERSYASVTPNVWGHKSNFASTTLDAVVLSPYTMFGERQGSSTLSYHQATIGIMCHELGHLMFGLPDLYDTDGSSDGIGKWGLMSGGSWNQVGVYLGDSPACLSAWSKVTLEMSTPVDVTTASVGLSVLNGDSNNSVRRIWLDKYRSPLSELFLIENRQLSGYDGGIPGAGMLIWHVDGIKTSNSDETHRLLDLEEADGLEQLSTVGTRGDTGDPYPGSTANTTFNDSSTPNSKDYTSTSTGVIVNTISASGNTMTADVTPKTIADGATIHYDATAFWQNAWWYATTTAWGAVRVTNSTSFDALDGIEFFLYFASTIDVYIYSGIPGGVLSGSPLYSETGISVPAGWKRLIFGTQQSFPVSSDLVLVVKVVSGSGGYIFTDGVSDADGRSFIDGDGSGTWQSMSDSLMLHALMGSMPPTGNVQ